MPGNRHFSPNRRSNQSARHLRAFFTGAYHNLLHCYAWELIALCLAIIGLIILLAMTYYCKNAERNEHLARIDQLERTLRQHDGVEDMLRGYLKAERERSAKYIQIEKDIGQANDKLRDIEGRYAEAEKEIEFWRCKDSVSAAADAYYTLGLIIKTRLPGSVLS